MIDLDSIFGNGDDEAIVEPIKLFKSLVRADKYESLRGDQQSILERWWELREQTDSLVKMNTGTGKTVVGLLMALSTLREIGGPVLYLCPNRQLVGQVVDEARSLGIPVVMDKPKGGLPPEFVNGEAILVTTFHKVFYGGSPFGTACSRSPIIPQMLVLDDAHACLAAASEQTTITLMRKPGAVEALVQRFRACLEAQSIGSAADVLHGRPGLFMQVPYWDWLGAISDVADILSSRSGDDDLKYKWPLVRDYLKESSCYIGSDRIEISVDVVPAEVAPTIMLAKRRVYMTATLTDDTALIASLRVSQQALQSPLNPSSRGDVGERLVIPVRLVDPGLDTVDIARFAADVAASGKNVVVITPSFEAGAVWAKHGATLVKKENVEAAVATLRNSNGNYIALANRYDGIDLPHDSCRLLILHDIPTVTSFADRHGMATRRTSRFTLGRQAQMIEQGMGRAVRSASDYAVVLLVGDQLTSFVAEKATLSLFSSETASQVEMGRKIAKASAKEGGLKGLRDVCELSWRRDAKWRKIHQDQLVRAAPSIVNPDRSALADAVGKAHELAASNRFQEAADTIQRALDVVSVDESERGWYLQAAAKHLHVVDPRRAVEVQIRAHQYNRNMLKPREGTRYTKLSRREGAQAQIVLDWVATSTDANAPIVRVDELLSRLDFGVPYAECERALSEVARLIGVSASRPEAEFGNGPDVLWLPTQGSAVVFEVKNEVLVSRNTIAKTEIGQLSVSANWFAERYQGLDCIVAVMHPADVVDADATPPVGMQVLNADGLSRLKGALRAFAKAIGTKDPSAWRLSEVAGCLNEFGLGETQLTKFLRPVRRQR